MKSFRTILRGKILEFELCSKKEAFDRMERFSLFKEGRKMFPHLVYGIGSMFFQPKMMSEDEFKALVARYAPVGNIIYARHW